MENETFLQRAREAQRQNAREEEHQPFIGVLLCDEVLPGFFILLEQRGQKIITPEGEQALLVEITITEESEPPVKVRIRSQKLNPREGFILVAFENLDEAIRLEEPRLGTIYDYSDYESPKYVRRIKLNEARELCDVVDAGFKEHKIKPQYNIRRFKKAP